MAYFLKIMSVIVAVLAVLAITLLVATFLAWDINSKVLLPEIVVKVSEWGLSAANIGACLSVLSTIIALLFPISLQIITEARGRYFSSQEVTSVVFNQCEYKGLYIVLFILIGFTFVSFWEPIPKWILFLMLCAICGSLIFLYFFFSNLEEIVSDFSKLVRDKEKSNVNRILKNGRN